MLGMNTPGMGVEELCSAILVSLNLSGVTSPDQRLQAQRWLEVATSSTEIFPAALAILGEGFSAPQPGLTNAIQHVVATMLVKRIRDSSVENRQALAGTLGPGLLGCVGGWAQHDPLAARRSGLPPPYISQTARALAALALPNHLSGVSEDPGGLAWTVAQALQWREDAGQCWGALVLLEALGAEGTRKSTEENARVALLQLASSMLSFLDGCLQSLSSIAQQDQVATIVRAILGTLQEWGGIGLTLTQIQKTGALLSTLSQAFIESADPEVAEVFVDVVEAYSSGCTKDDDWTTAMQSFAQVLVVKRSSLVQADDHTLRCLYRGAACIAVAGRSWVASQAAGQTVSGLIQLLLEGSASQNIRTAGLCIEVWPQLLRTPARHRSAELQGALFDQLIPILLPQALAPQQDSEEDIEEWMVFREQILAEALHACYLETHVRYLQLLTENLSNNLNLELNDDPEPWRPVEATLFSMRCVSYAVQKRALLSVASPSALSTAAKAGITAHQETAEDIKTDAIATSEQLGNFLQLISQTQPPSGPLANPRALSAATHCLSQFAQFMAKVAPEQFREQVLSFLVSALASNRGCWTHGTQAVRNLASRAATSLAARPSVLPTLLQVWDQVVPTDMGSEERCTLAQGICRIIAAVETEDPTSLEMPLTQLAMPILNNLQQLLQSPTDIAAQSPHVASQLQALATILRSLARCPGIGEYCLKIVSGGWTTLTSIIDVFVGDDSVANALSQLFGRILGLLQVSGPVDLGLLRLVLQASEPLITHKKIVSAMSLLEELADTLGPPTDLDCLQQHQQIGSGSGEGTLGQVVAAYADFVMGAALTSSPPPSGAPLAMDPDLKEATMTTGQRLVVCCPLTYVVVSCTCAPLLATAAADLATPADLSVQSLLLLTVFSNLPSMVGALSMEQHLRPAGSSERWNYLQNSFETLSSQCFQSLHQNMLFAILGIAPENLLDPLSNLFYDIFQQHFEHTKNILSTLLQSDSVVALFSSNNSSNLSYIQIAFHKLLFSQTTSFTLERDYFCSFLKDVWRVCSGIANADVFNKY